MENSNSTDIGHHDSLNCSPVDHVYCFREKGKLHRINGPALKTYSGDEKWYYDGVLNRKDGPAIIRKNGTKEWFEKGIRHRVGGPAIEYASGNKEYWVNGKYIPQ